MKQSSNHFTQQAREHREQRKEKFLIEFNSSQRYVQLKQKLKKAIFRLAVEKYNKEVDHEGLKSKFKKEQFKAELYTFMQEQMKVFLNQAVDFVNTKSGAMHQDLKLDHQISKDEARKKIEKNFHETEAEKFSRLTKEYDLIGDYEHSEWYILYLKEMTDPSKLFDLSVKRPEDGNSKKWYEYA